MMYLFYIVVGFLSGSIMYSMIIPKIIKGIDITAEPEDSNPGAANAISQAGVLLGSICLLLDLLKGAIPVMMCAMQADINNIWFSIVMAAPVLGHAVSFRQINKKGGKAIAVSFGTLIGLLPHSFVVFALVAPYLVFSLLFKIREHSKRTIVSFLSAIIISMLFTHSIAIVIGMILISVIVVYKHYEILYQVR